ncbi:MAG: hypothetical protein L6245_02895, partial [Thermodesulfovibrionales bacterium]|nr:hypothetical protein [Thermodesulfovibrionales bacterium]
LSGSVSPTVFILFKRVVSSFIAYYEFAKILLSSIQRQYKPTGIKLPGGIWGSGQMDENVRISILP